MVQDADLLPFEGETQYAEAHAKYIDIQMPISGDETYGFYDLDPSDPAFKLDESKDIGFNMIRKHIKVEPAAWYTYCDRKGIIVWQDMPSGDRNPEWQMHQYFTGTELKRSAESEACYRKEWKEIMDFLYSYP